MKLVAVILAAAAPVLLAQRAPSPTGFGRMMFPGGTAPQGVQPTGRLIFPSGGAPAITRPGRPINANVPPPRQNHSRHSLGFTVPFPVFYGGGYYDLDAPPAQLANYPQTVQPAYMTVPQSLYPANEQPPVVIINQYFRPEDAPRNAAPAAAIQTQPESEAPKLADRQQEEPLFLIAMKDHTVYVARAYWVDEGILHYITTEGTENSASLDAVDRDLSRRLNRERSVAFGLPAN